MSKTLNTIQTLSKIGKILSKIVFIFCIVGMSLCLVSVITMALGFEGAFKLGGVTINSIIGEAANVSADTIYATMVLGLVSCIWEAVIAKYSEDYFANELKAGTPFTFNGAKEMLRLGIITISVSIGGEIASSIILSIMKKRMEVNPEFELDSIGSVTIGIMFIVISLIFKYGAEIIENKEKEDKNA